MTSALSRQGYRVFLLARRSLFPLGSKIWKESCRRYGEKNRSKTTLIWWPFKHGAEIALTAAALLLLPFLGRRIMIHTRIRYLGYLASLLNYSVIYESHVPPQSPLHKKMESRLLRAPKVHFVVISRQLQHIYQQMGCNTDKMLIAPDAGRQTGHRLSRRNDYRGASIHLGYIGSLYQGRGFEMILEIAKRMPERYFHIIGNLATLFPSAGHLPNNIYLYDQVTPHQAELMTRFFDILLMPYQNEVKIGIGMDTGQWMSPLKMFEYLHSGRPMIASDLPALREVLRDSENCLLVPPDDVDAWVQAIKKLDDEEFRYRLAQQALLDARHYTWERRMANILSSSPQEDLKPAPIIAHERSLPDSN